MKRSASRVASTAGLLPARRDRASGSEHRAVADVASCLSAVGGSLGGSTEDRDPGLVADFVDFLEAGRGTSPRTRPPDPEFTEQLRRRLWRMHLLARRRTDPDATH